MKRKTLPYLTHGIDAGKPSGVAFLSVVLVVLVFLVVCSAGFSSKCAKCFQGTSFRQTIPSRYGEGENGFTDKMATKTDPAQQTHTHTAAGWLEAMLPLAGIEPHRCNGTSSVE